MKDVLSMPRLPLGIYPTPFYKLEGISAKYGKNIWIKRDDLCGVALGGNKVRKLEYLLADAKAQGCDTVFTTGGAQSNHAMLTAACAARLGMKCILPLKQRGVTDHKGNLILDDIYGAEVRFIDTDSYEDIYAEMHRWGEELAKDGHKTYDIPVGGSTALGALGYVNCVREFTAQAREAGIQTPLRRSSLRWLRVQPRFWIVPSSGLRMIFRWSITWVKAMPSPIRKIPSTLRNWPEPKAFSWTLSILEKPGPVC